MTWGTSSRQGTYVSSQKGAYLFLTVFWAGLPSPQKMLQTGAFGSLYVATLCCYELLCVWLLVHTMNSGIVTGLVYEMDLIGKGSHIIDGFEDIQRSVVSKCDIYIYIYIYIIIYIYIYHYIYIYIYCIKV